MIFENVAPGVDTVPRVGEHWWRQDWLTTNRPHDFVVVSVGDERFSIRQSGPNAATGFYMFVGTDWCYERDTLQCAECDAPILTEDHYLCEECRNGQ